MNDEVLLKLTIQIQPTNEKHVKNKPELDLDELLSPFESIFDEFGEIFEEENSEIDRLDRNIKLAVKLRQIGCL